VGQSFAQTQTQAQGVRFLDVGELPSSAIRLGPVEGLSCKRNFYDPGASESDALNKLRFQVLSIGGNAVFGMSCAPEGTTLSRNCWSAVVCRGIAARIEAAQQPAERIASRDRPEESSGTGFVVSSDGVILTNSHVVRSCRSVNVKIDGVEGPAMVSAQDRSNDLAIVRMQSNQILRPLIFRNTAPRLAEPVAALGFPLPGVLAPTVGASTGTVSALAGIQGDARFLQISVPIQPGNSGGPLLDTKGAVVGVIVGKLNALRVANITGDIPQNVNFAIGLRTVQTFLESNGISYQSGEGSAADLTAAVQVSSPSVVQVICTGGG
jgi:S1-C subfamily serine protease